VRIAVAVVSHEACTFNPTPTGLASFEARCLLYGRELLEDPPPAAGFLRGFVTTMPQIVPDVELLPSIAARTTAGGRMARETLDSLRTTIVDGLQAAGNLDGMAFCLHGASAAEGEDDVEGHLLEAVREVVGPDLPIGVPLDHHANITQRMVEKATFLIGDRYQPHDKFDTGRLLAEMLAKVIRGEIDPVMVHRKLPLISHQEQYLTSKPPMKTWFDLARAHETADSPILSVSTFPMQPWLDVTEAGYTVVVVSDGDHASAEQVADEVADLAWSLRADFQVKDSVPPAEAVARAAESNALTVISDTGDSVGGGSGGDSTTMLEEFLRHGGPRALIPLVHPPIAEMVGDLEVGQQVTLEVGGAVTGWWKPVRVTGTVRAVDADYTAPDNASVRHLTSSNPLPFQNSRYCGPTVALEVDNVMLVVSAKSGPAGRAPVHYTGLGIDVGDYDAAVLKTASNFQFWTEDLTTNLVRANTPGPTQSDVADLPWTRIPRPMYPLDPDLTDWR
jgi:microcystin degradation protein MlrC